MALVLLLLMRPMLLAEFKGERPAGVVLLLDNSQSMTQQDRRLIAADKFRVAIAKGLVAADSIKITDSHRSAPSRPRPRPTRSAPTWSAGVLQHHELKLTDGLEKLRPAAAVPVRPAAAAVPPEDSRAPSWSTRCWPATRPTTANTALADAINEVLQRPGRAAGRAIVLMTDGRDNASKVPLPEAARECARLKVPLHIYGVGSAEGGNLQLKEVSVPDTIFVDDTVSVPRPLARPGLQEGHGRDRR